MNSSFVLILFLLFFLTFLKFFHLKTSWSCSPRELNERCKMEPVRDENMADHLRKDVGQPDAGTWNYSLLTRQKQRLEEEMVSTLNPSKGG